MTTFGIQDDQPQEDPDIMQLDVIQFVDDEGEIHVCIQTGATEEGMLIYTPAPAEPILEVESSGSAFLDKLLKFIPGTPFEKALFVFGLLGQAVFMSRFLLQWIVSERRGKSVVPVGFWWLSLAGASMLLTYFIIRSEPVGAIGQSFGWIVYTRNLILIRRDHKRTTSMSSGA